MGKRSVKEDKNAYFRAREDAGFTRAEAADRTSISESRIEKIENRNQVPHPDEVLAMANAYGAPIICNYYCSHDCKIGQEYVPEIQVRHLTQAVLEMLASMNELDEQKNRLVAIAADGIIDETEIRDLAKIQTELARVQNAISSFNHWVDDEIARGTIDKETLEKEKQSL